MMCFFNQGSTNELFQWTELIYILINYYFFLLYHVKQKQEKRSIYNQRMIDLLKEKCEIDQLFKISKLKSILKKYMKNQTVQTEIGKLLPYRIGIFSNTKNRGHLKNHIRNWQLNFNRTIFLRFNRLLNNE